MKRFDIAILGSGFASSLCGAILAKQGKSVIIIDRSKHPRFSIGESTTPAADFLLHHLAQKYGLNELLPLCTYGEWKNYYPEVRCGCKRGFSYVWHGDGTDYKATANHANELMVTANASRDVADTQWYRPDVDGFFMRVAIQCGVVVWEQATIEAMNRSHGRWSISGKIDTIGSNSRSEIQSFEINAGFVIDGSGPNSPLMATQGGEDLTASLLTNTNAVFGHFYGGQSTLDWLRERGARISDFPYPFDQAAVHHVFRDGWMWQIGFDTDLTSLGFVTNLQSSGNLRHGRSSMPLDVVPDASAAREAWEERLHRYPVLKELYGGLAEADFPGRMFALPRIQRLRSQAAGDGWAALSFTVGFIDPLHSTGIAHSLSTVERICKILLESEPLQFASHLRSYSKEVIGELKHIDRMIATCYAALGNFELFTAATMIYFAAAITLERHRGLNLDTGFLLAKDACFQKIVEKTHHSLFELNKSQKPASPHQVRSVLESVTKQLVPYNDVGLFTPETPNMILHTVAAKA
jgi:FADH2 O2-dependent halogenase